MLVGNNEVQFRGRAPDHLFSGKARGVEEAGVSGNVAAITDAVDGHRVGVGVEGFGKSFFGFLQAGLGLLAVCDVEGRAGDADDVAVAVALRLDHEIVPARFAGQRGAYLLA